MEKTKLGKRNKLGQNVFFSNGAKVDNNVSIGNNVTIYEKVFVKTGVTIFDGAVVGRPPKATKTMSRKVEEVYKPLIIGKGSIIGANAVIYTGVRIGEEVLIGDMASIREDCEIGNGSVIGRGVMVMYNTKIGKRTRIIDGAIITGNMVIEDDVFIGPGVNSINDNQPYLSRFGLSKLEIMGPIVRRFALIGAGANLKGGVEIGEGAIVAPNAMVTHNVEAWTVVAGLPARLVRRIPRNDANKIKLLSLKNNV